MVSDVEAAVKVAVVTYVVPVAVAYIVVATMGAVVTGLCYNI